ncbi:MAG: ABC transporter permease [bacterium]|nr:ABC transporter permease [bacterium]
MKSKTSFFNSSLFWNFNKRHWPLWIVYLAAMAIAVILPIAMMDGRAVSDYYISLNTIPFAFVLAFAAAFFAFRHLSSPTASVFFGSLPVKRTGIFTTMFLAGFLPLIACNVAIVLIGLIASIGKFAVATSALLAWFAMMSMADLVFYAMAVLCVQFTGISWMSGVLYAGANVVATALEYLVTGILGLFIYGSSFSGSFFQWASPLINISWISHVGISGGHAFSEGWMQMLLYTLFGIVCIIVAAVLYKRRKFERVSEIIAFKGLRPVFKYLMAIIFALGIGTLLFELCFNPYGISMTLDLTLALIAFMIIGGVLGYLATSMLVNKLARVSKRDLIGAAIVALCCVAFGFACYSDMFGVESRVPEAGKVESVTVSAGEFAYAGGASSAIPTSVFTSEEGIGSVTDAHRAILADHDSGLIAENDLADGSALPESENATQGYVNITIAYKMKSGYTMTRSYDIYGSTDLFEGDEHSMAKLAEACDSMEARESRYQVLSEMAEKATSECTIDFIGADEYSSYSVLVKPSQVRELVSGPLKQDMREASGCAFDLKQQFTSNIWVEPEERITLSLYTNDSDADTVEIDKELTPNAYKWVMDNVNRSL